MLKVIGVVAPDNPTLERHLIVLCPRCMFCQQAEEVTVTEQQWDKLATRAHIQDVFHDWSKERRELLITGTHPECWDALDMDE